jgi:lipopolysaccharide export system protein LptC
MNSSRIPAGSGLPPRVPPRLPQADLRTGRGTRLSGLSPRASVRLARIGRRRWTVGLMKRLLPVLAIGLLACLALWPEFAGDADHSRFTFRRATVTPEGGQLSDARYQGVDESGHPYTLTAALARQVSPDRVDLVDPKGDISPDSASWAMVDAREGVFRSRDGQLDLSGEVSMYRDDGTTLHTASMAIDLKAGAAASAEKVHVEGPFGTLDAQGFTLTDRGGTIHFMGPGRLLLNGRP